MSQLPDPVLAQGDKSSFALGDHIYSRLLRERIIWLGSEVRDENANQICAQLLLLAAERAAEAEIEADIEARARAAEEG